MHGWAYDDNRVAIEEAIKSVPKTFFGFEEEACWLPVGCAFRRSYGIWSWWHLQSFCWFYTTNISWWCMGAFWFRTKSLNLVVKISDVVSRDIRVTYIGCPTAESSRTIDIINIFSFKLESKYCQKKPKWMTKIIFSQKKMCRLYQILFLLIFKRHEPNMNQNSQQVKLEPNFIAMTKCRDFFIT
jgi:hypothetical protein